MVLVGVLVYSGSYHLHLENQIQPKGITHFPIIVGSIPEYPLGKICFLIKYVSG